MDIRLSALRSRLSYSEEFDAITTAFIQDIECELGDKLSVSDLADYDCDLKLIYIESGGSEGLFLSHIEELKEPYYLLTNGSNNSLAASLEIMTYCNIHHKKGEILHGSSSYIAKRIRLLALANRVKNGLAHAKFGVLGQPSDWLIASVPSYNAVEDKLGCSFESVSLLEVQSEFSKLTTADLSLLPDVFTREERLKALRTYEAFNRIARKHELSGFTVRCFDLLKPLATTGCVGLALMNDNGIIAACEGDIAALLSMHIVKLMTGESVFQANPSRISTDDNTIVFAHCTVPLKMADHYSLDTHFESNTGIAIKGYLKEGDVTVFRLSADLKHWFASNGHIEKNLQEKDLCRTQVLVKLEKDVEELLRTPCGNHHILFYGHWADELDTVLENIL